MRYLAVAAHNIENPTPFSVEFECDRTFEVAERRARVAFVHIFRDTDYFWFGMRVIPTDLTPPEIQNHVTDIVESYGEEEYHDDAE